MDPIPRYVNENENNSLSEYDLNLIKNLSLEGHNQKLNLGADELQNQFNRSLEEYRSMPLKPEKLPKVLLEAFCKGFSPTATCYCGGPMNYPDHSGVNSWTFPKQKLYSAAEDPTRKKYSPLEGPGPRKYTPLSNVQG